MRHKRLVYNCICKLCGKVAAVDDSSLVENSIIDTYYYYCPNCGEKGKIAKDACVVKEYYYEG